MNDTRLGNLFFPCKRRCPSSSPSVELEIVSKVDRHGETRAVDFLLTTDH
jgi:hypothetical protein